ncbi:MAG: RNA polymerase sigma-54 factor [Gemmobacter sp.]
MTQRIRTQLAQTQKLRLTQGLTAALRLLRFDASGLTRYLEEQAAENAALQLKPPDVPPGEWLPRWSGVLARGPELGDDPAGRIVAAGPSLMSHVTGTIARMFPGPRDRHQALLFAMALEPSGWLGRSVAAIAAEAGLTRAEGEAMLARLQDIEPAGLFARSLRECLELQAREAGWLDAAMVAVLAHLDLVAAGDPRAIARRSGVDEAAIAQALRRLRGFNPKPGAQFDPGAAPVREPDLVVVRGGQGWQVALNRGALPAVAIAPPGQDKAARQAAQGIARQVEARGVALLRIAAEVLRRQEAMLDHGAASLLPLTMAEVAETLGLHESTVSRAVAGVSFDSPRGTFWLRALFSGGVGSGEGAPSAAALRARLAGLVADEDPGAPLSDAALARLLVAPGQAPPARRTVAKYRSMLSIPPAYGRRRTPG